MNLIRILTHRPNHGNQPDQTKYEDNEADDAVLANLGIVGVYKAAIKISDGDESRIMQIMETGVAQKHEMLSSPIKEIL